MIRCRRGLVTRSPGRSRERLEHWSRAHLGVDIQASEAYCWCRGTRRRTAAPSSATTSCTRIDWLADTVQFAHVILVTKVTATGDHVLTAVTGYVSADPNPADNSADADGDDSGAGCAGAGAGGAEAVDPDRGGDGGQERDRDLEGGDQGLVGRFDRQVKGVAAASGHRPDLCGRSGTRSRGRRRQATTTKLAAGHTGSGRASWAGTASR